MKIGVDAGARDEARGVISSVEQGARGINIVLAVIAALLFHLVGYLPDTAAQWVAENLKNALIVSVVLAVFNLLPLPPLDGGRIANIAYQNKAAIHDILFTASAETMVTIAADPKHLQSAPRSGTIVCA